MKTKLWEKGTRTDTLIERFTVRMDRQLDIVIAPYDIIASRAHAKMLCKCGLINDRELAQLEEGLGELEMLIREGKFEIEEGIEDVHSQIEFFLTQKFGETGKKIHTARSRNDQVLTAIKLYLRAELKTIRKKSLTLKAIFEKLSAKYKDVNLPGYTHLQVAMPSTFGLWFGAWAEAIEDDIEQLDAAIKICDKNPLGSAAGYGSSFKIDRELTTREMGFSQMNWNVVYAQMTRGKSEKAAAVGISSLAQTISRFSYDVCLYMCQNFGFVSLPEEFTTGSSIMPHKKNPDVFELLRASCNVIQGVPNQLTLLTVNLPSGYHRDMQLTKELIIPAMTQMQDCLDVLIHVLPRLQVNKNILEDDKYRYIHSVEEINRLVESGIPFRDAYALVAGQIRNNTYQVTETETQSL